MNLAMLIVGLAGAGAGIGSAVFAYVQAKAATDSRRDAVKARDDAQAAELAAGLARDAAVKAQQETAGAADRIAKAMERREAADAAKAAERPIPWALRSGTYRKNGRAVILVLQGSREVADVTVSAENRPAIWHLTPSVVPSTWQPGDSLEIYYATVGSQSGRPTLVVQWRWSDRDEIHLTREPLT